MTEPTHELEAYFAGIADAEQLRAVESWIHADPANARAFMEQLHFRELVGQHLRERSDHASLALVELARLEASALPVMIASEPDVDQASNAPDPRLTKDALLDAGRYVLSHAMHSKSVRWSAGVAAALLLAVTLVIVLVAINPPAAPIAQTPDNTERVNPRFTSVVPVATLTAQHDAQWENDFDFGTPELNDTLYAGQRLTLTAGHAQITTNRQATLLIQAPCTVELVDNPNTIRLINGKLVGYVGNETAKGLLVRTPHMDITDLGTRFGVACDANATSLRVFEGEVLAAAPASDAVQRTVKASESVRINANSTTIQPIETQPDRFVTSLAALANPPVLTGGIQYEPSIPSDLSIGAYENSEIRLIQEKTGVELTDPISVNVVGTGRFENDSLQLPVTLKATTVDSYLIHLDTPLNEGSGKTHRATIRFDRPIVGLITNAQAMADSHSKLGLPDVRYASMGDSNAGRFTGLDQSNDNQQESVEISEDRRTLTLHISTGDGIDQARVLIQSQASP